MTFIDEQNLITIIQSGFSNYKKYLLNRKFIYVYYNDINSQYEYFEVIFKKRHFKHLCGISDEEKDLEVYRMIGVPKEVVSAKDFFDLCNKKRLGRKHIILKKDGSTVQKMNILNNLYRLTVTDTVHCKIYETKNALTCDAMIGLETGSITIALSNISSYAVPKSSLDFDIKDSGEHIYKVVLIACKNIGDKNGYKNIRYSSVKFEDLPENIKELFK